MYEVLSLRRLRIRGYHLNDLIGPNRPINAHDLFYLSFTQARAKFSLFFHYVDLEYEVITQMT